MATLILIKVWFSFVVLTLVQGSPTSDLLESVDCFLRDCERYFPNADRNMAENIIVHLEGAIDSVQGLLDSLDPSEAENTQRIPILKTLMIQLRILLSRWELILTNQMLENIEKLRGPRMRTNLDQN